MSLARWRAFEANWPKEEDAGKDREDQEWTLADGIGLHIMSNVLSYSFLVISNRLRRSEKSCKEHSDRREEYHTIPPEERTGLRPSEVKTSMVGQKEIADRVDAFVASSGSSEKILASLKPWGYAGIQGLASMIINDLREKEPVKIPSGPASYRVPQDRTPKPYDVEVRDVRNWLNTDAKHPTVCKYYSAGGCHRGDDCSFLHQARSGERRSAEGTRPSSRQPETARSASQYEPSRKRSYEDVSDRRHSRSDDRARDRTDHDRRDSNGRSPRRRSSERYRSPARYDDRRERHDDRRYDDRRYDDRRHDDRRYDDRDYRRDYPDRYERPSSVYSRDTELKRPRREEESPLLTRPAVSASDSIKNGEPLLEKVRLATGDDQRDALTVLDKYLTLQSKQAKADDNLHIYEYLISVIERAPGPHRPRYLKFMNGYLALNGMDAKTRMQKIMSSSKDAKSSDLLSRYNTLDATVSIDD